MSTERFVEKSKMRRKEKREEGEGGRLGLGSLDTRACRDGDHGLPSVSFDRVRAVDHGPFTHGSSWTRYS